MLTSTFDLILPSGRTPQLRWRCQSRHKRQRVHEGVWNLSLVGSCNSPKPPILPPAKPSSCVRSRVWAIHQTLEDRSHPSQDNRTLKRSGLDTHARSRSPQCCACVFHARVDTRSEPAASVRKELSTFIRGEPPNQ